MYARACLRMFTCMCACGLMYGCIGVCERESVCVSACVFTFESYTPIRVIHTFERRRVKSSFSLVFRTKRTSLVGVIGVVGVV